MFKKWSLPILGVGAMAAALLFPSAALAAGPREPYRHSRSHVGFSIGFGTPGPYYVGPYAPYVGPGYANGYYDAWGRFHPYIVTPYVPVYGQTYGHYDRYGRWVR